MSAKEATHPTMTHGIRPCARLADNAIHTANGHWPDVDSCPRNSLTGTESKMSRPWFHDRAESRENARQLPYHAVLRSDISARARICSAMLELLYYFVLTHAMFFLREDLL